MRLLLIAVLTLLATGCAGADRPALDPAIILDADQDGAILFDGRDKTYRGVRRDGSVAWTVPAQAQAPSPAGCLARCPDAVLSGSAVSANSASAPDPAPVFLVAGQRKTAGLAGVKRAVLTADGPDDLVLSAGDGLAQWLEVRAGGMVTHRVPVPGFHTSWRDSADGGWALAITVRTGGSATGGDGTGEGTARWFHRDTAGWQPAPESIAVTGTTSCLSPDGSAAMLLGQRPTVLDHTGRGQPVTDLELAGACALGAGGGIVADLFQTAGGTRSDIRVFDAAHAITWRRDVPGEALLSAHGTRVVYTSGNQAHELDLRTGAELRAVPAVRAARYDRTGALVVVDAEGHPRWLD